MRMPHSSVIPDYSGGFSELREVTDNIMDPSNPVDVGLMGLGMAPIPGARVPIGLRALSKAAQYILQNGLGKARRLFPKGAIDDAVVELGKRESQIIKKSKEARDYKKSDYMKDAREGLRRKERNKRSQDLMTKKDPDYYLDDYPVEKPLGFAGGGMPTIMMNPDMPVMRFQRGGMPRSPLMMQEPFIPQRPPRMFINDEVPTNDFVPFSEREGFGELPSEFMPPPPRKQFLQRPPSIEEERPPMQYIGEDAPRMGMPPEMPQFPGRQPKFPGMMQPIRDPEPVGPLPMMPPLTPITTPSTVPPLISADGDLEALIRGDLPPPRRTYINEGAPRPITEEEILQIDPDYFKQPGDDRGFIPMPLDYGMNNTPAPPRPETLEANPLPLTPDPETPIPGKTF